MKKLMIIAVFLTLPVLAGCEEGATQGPSVQRNNGTTDVVYRRADGGVTEVTYTNGSNWLGNRTTQVKSRRYGSEREYSDANTDWKMTAATIGVAILVSVMQDAWQNGETKSGE